MEAITSNDQSPVDSILSPEIPVNPLTQEMDIVTNIEPMLAEPQLPVFNSAVVCTSATTLDLPGINLTIKFPITQQAIELLKLHMIEMQKICMQNSFYQTAYTSGFSPTTFSTAAQQSSQQEFGNDNQQQEGLIPANSRINL